MQVGQVVARAVFQRRAVAQMRQNMGLQRRALLKVHSKWINKIHFT